LRELVRAVHHPGPRDASGTATEVIHGRPGLVASTLVANLDGRRVVNVARWRTSDDARDAGRRPGRRVHRHGRAGSQRRARAVRDGRGDPL